MASPQSAQDSYAIFQSRLAANWPSLSMADMMASVALAQAFLSDVQDVRVLLTQSAPNISAATATGDALVAQGANVGVRPVPATPTVVALQLSRANPGDTSTTIVVQANTVVSTQGGDGLSVIPQAFSLNSTATISSGQITAPALVQATATTPGSASNVAPNTVVAPVVATGTGVAWTVTNPPQGAGGVLGYTTAGTDGDGPQAGAAGTATFRYRIQAATAPIYSTAAMIAAMIATPGVAIFDAFVLDPQDGTSTLTYRWALVDGSTPGLSGATITAGTPAAAVDAQVRSVLPPNVLPTANAFTVTNLTSVSVSYSADPSQADATLRPQIQAAVVAYIQSLTHGQTPTQFGMQNAVNIATGYVLMNFQLTAATPAIAAAAATQLYRANGTPTAVVSVTRA